MRRDPKHLTLLRGGEPALEERPDDELMQLAAADVSSAFEALTRRHQAAVRRYCARRCGVGLGDEVAQDVFLSLWTTRAEYQPRGRFRAYLFTLAERRCHNATRDRKRAAARNELASPPPEPDTALDTLLARERQRRLFAMVDALQSEQRRAILLHYAAGLDYEDIAVLTERAPATVRSRVFLGLAQLRKRLTKGGEP
ncbi:MAG: family polymerase sigma factor [Myxococcaceae bacterium]|nr:family polymerase sigma factor [Myxococcaceae bacterium]